MNYPQKVKFGNRQYLIEYQTAKKSTCSVRLKGNRIVLRLSRFLHGRERDEMVEKFLGWAFKKLENLEVNDFVLPVYENGGRVCTHNKVYEISVIYDGRSTDRVAMKDGYLIEIKLNKNLSMTSKEKKIQYLAEKAIINDQKEYLHQVIDEINAMYFQQQYNFCRFKRMNTRFGSCSSKRNLNIAYRLLFAPREVFKYVCIHELAHLKEMNHGERFWSLVLQADPDYKQKEKWLKNNGFMLG